MIWLVASAAAADLTVGGTAGLGIPRGTLTAGPAPALEVGARLPHAEGRLHLGAQASWLRSTAEVPLEGWTGDVLHHQGRLSVAVTARALELDAQVSPFVALGPSFGWTATVVDDFLVESGPRLGAHSAAGLEVAAGPGHVRLVMAGDLLGAAELLGVPRHLILTPGLGYRL